MTLLLSNEDVEQVLTMPECLDVLERAYTEQAAGRVINRPRTDMYAPHSSENAFYVFKSFEGLLPSENVAALRLNSDVISWSSYAGTIRKDKAPLANGRWTGLLLLFSTETGEPLAILPDGVVQRMRVGATNGLAARYLARQDASVYGLLGAGWQAGAQVMAMSAVRPLGEVRVFSPNAEHRAAFADEWSENLGVPIRAVGSAEEAVRGADIVGAATNSMRPLINSSWLAPGVFLTCVKRSEIGEDVLATCSPVVVHTHVATPYNYFIQFDARPIPAEDPVELAIRLRDGQAVSEEEIAQLEAEAARPPEEPELQDLVGGRTPGRTTPDQRTAFVNNVGLGIQFAAVGALAYRKARQRGLGRDMPTEWFTESVHP